MRYTCSALDVKTETARKT